MSKEERKERDMKQLRIPKRKRSNNSNDDDDLDDETLVKYLYFVLSL